MKTPKFFIFAVENVLFHGLEGLEQIIANRTGVAVPGPLTHLPQMEQFLLGEIPEVDLVTAWMVRSKIHEDQLITVIQTIRERFRTVGGRRHENMRSIAYDLRDAG